MQLLKKLYNIINLISSFFYNKLISYLYNININENYINAQIEL